MLQSLTGMPRASFESDVRVKTETFFFLFSLTFIGNLQESSGGKSSWYAEKARGGSVGIMEESMLLSIVLWVLYLGKSLKLLSLRNWLVNYTAWTLANGYALNRVTISVQRLKSHPNKKKRRK